MLLGKYLCNILYNENNFILFTIYWVYELYLLSYTVKITLYYYCEKLKNEQLICFIFAFYLKTMLMH